MINIKHIIVIDLVLVVGTLLLIAGFVGYARPLVIAPLDGAKTTSNSVLFVFEKADSILIDDNLDFSSPQKYYAKDNLEINLKPGTYYWKVEGALNSIIRELTIQSEIGLRINEKEENYEVVNAGNTILNVDVYEGDQYKETVKLEVQDTVTKSGDKFIGGEKNE